ncbi:MAG: PAS domain S-box protein, partial [Deltaproteobacteria bacterium]
MTQEKDSNDTFSALRSQAEELLGPVSVDQKDISALFPDETQRLVHELRVHQIELEMQNEELRQAQLKLEDLKNKYRDNYLDLYDFAPVGYMTLNDKGLILESNLTAVGLLGVERMSLIKMFFSRFVCQEFGDVFYLYLQQVFESQSKQTCEIKLTRKDGTVFDAQLESIPVQDESGHSIRCRTILTDISDRKLAEDALHESQENFRTFFETMDDIIVVGTPDGKIIYSNPALSRKLGYSSDELKAMQILDLHPIEKRQEAEIIFAEMFKGERDVCPLPLVKKDGVYLPVETRVCFGKWSGMDCIFGISKDLSKEQEALQKFNRLFSSNPAPMAVSSFPKRKFTDVNDSFLSTLGFSREEVIGKTSEELGLFTEPQIQRQMAQVLQDQGYVRNVELKVRKKDGTIVEGLFSGEIIENQGQKSFLTVMLDITERKRAEEVLQIQNQKFLGVLNVLDALVYVTDMKTYEIVFINRYGQNIWGDIKGNICWQTIQEDQAGPCEFCTNSQLIGPDGNPTEGVSWEFQNTVNKRWYDCRDRAIYWPDGRIVRMEIATDITERKRVEEALQGSQERLELALKGADLGLWDLDLTTGQGVVNQRMVEIIGYSPDEVETSLDVWQQFIHPDDIGFVREHLNEHYEGRTDFVDHEYRIQTKSGQHVWVLARGRVVQRGEDGRPLRMAGTVRDISERKQAEQERENLRAQLLQSQKMETMGTLAAGIAH